MDYQEFQGKMEPQVQMLPQVLEVSSKSVNCFFPSYKVMMMGKHFHLINTVFEAE